MEFGKRGFVSTVVQQKGALRQTRIDIDRASPPGKAPPALRKALPVGQKAFRSVRTGKAWLDGEYEFAPILARQKEALGLARIALCA